MRAGIIGFGGQGRRVAQAIRSIPGLELKSVADLSEQALSGPELADVDKSQQAEAVWRDGLDLLCITTHGPSHAPLSIAAMEAGVRRVMVEKPMACSVAECQKMLQVAERTGSRLAVNQSRRHDPLYRLLRDNLASEAWGELRAMFIQRPGIGLGCLGTHYFDLIRFLSGRDAKAVSGWVDPFIGPNPRGKEFHDPGGLVVLDLGDRVRGVVAQIEDGAGPMTVEIHTTAARILIDEYFDKVEITIRDRSVATGPGRPAAYVNSPRPEASAKVDATKMTRGVISELSGDGPMDCDAIHGQASIEVLVAAHLSSTRGNAPQALPLGAEDRQLWLPIT